MFCICIHYHLRALTLFFLYFSTVINPLPAYFLYQNILKTLCIFIITYGNVHMGMNNYIWECPFRNFVTIPTNFHK